MIHPQLVCDAENPEALFFDDEFRAEEKLDGDRRIIVRHKEEIRAFTRNGNCVIVPEVCVALAMLADCEWFCVDGEMMPGGRFVAFRVISLNGAYVGDEESAVWLRNECPFDVVRSAIGEVQKRALAECVRGEGGEGLVFKRRFMPYREGERHLDWQRHKNYETDAFLVESVDIARCSIAVSLNGVDCGRVACSLNRLPRVGEQVRVRYDRVTEGGKLLRARLA